MSKKGSRRLWFVLLLSIFVLAFASMAAIPTARKASAESMPGYGTGSSFFYGPGGADTMFEIRDAASGNKYLYGHASGEHDTYNPDFRYPLGTAEAAFAESLWTIRAYDWDYGNNAFTEEWPEESLDLLVTYYATYNPDDETVAYLEAAPSEAGLYDVVICILNQKKPVAYASVYLYEKQGPLSMRANEATYGEYTGEEILSALTDTEGNDLAAFSALYKEDPTNGGRMEACLYAVVDPEDPAYDAGVEHNAYYTWAEVEDFTEWSEAYPYTAGKAVVLPVGRYEIRFRWYETDDEHGAYAEGTLYIPFEIKPLVIHKTDYTVDDFTVTWSDEPIAPLPELSAFDAELVWYYDDGSETGAVLPSGLALRPDSYDVWPMLEGADADAGNVLLGGVAVGGTLISQGGFHATLTINPISLSFDLSDALFEGLTYSNTDSFAFVNTLISEIQNDAAVQTFAAKWGEPDLRVEWKYVSDEKQYPFDASCDADDYAITYALAGEHAYLFSVTVTKGGAAFPQDVAVAPCALTDVILYFGEDPPNILKTYLTAEPTASDLNVLYYHPNGFIFGVTSSAAEKTLRFDGWKTDLSDEKEAPTFDISERVGETFYAYNIRVVKEEGGVWVSDPNYAPAAVGCAVTVARRRIEIEPTSSVIYDGTVKKPDFLIKGFGDATYTNPGEDHEHSFLFDDPQSVLEEAADLLETGTTVGDAYRYGVRILETDKYAFYYQAKDESAPSEHDAFTWVYSISAMSPTIQVVEIEDWYYGEAIEIGTGTDEEKRERFLSYLGKKLSVTVETIKIGDEDGDGVDDNAVEIADAEWSYAGSEWFSAVSGNFDSSIADQIGKEISFRIVTSASSSGNVKSGSAIYTFTVAKAPIYLIYDEDAVNPPAASGAVSVAWREWSAVLYHEDGAVDPFLRDARFDCDYDGNGQKAFEDVFAVATGAAEATYAGKYSFTIGFNSAAEEALGAYYRIANPTVNYTVSWCELGTERFNLPAEFVYGGDSGKDYYKTPFIDYVASSDGEDTNDSAVVGAVTGFGAAEDAFKYPVEVWEFSTDPEAAKGAGYEGEWTLWTEETFPKDAGTYYVRYSAKFYYLLDDEYEWDETAGKWVVLMTDAVLERGKYTLPYKYGSFEITPRAITLEWGGVNETYTGGGHQATVNATLAYEESLNEEITYTQDSFVNAGTYELTASVKDNALGNKNYSITNASAEMVVAKPVLTVKAADWAITYGEACPTPTYTIEGFVNGETEEALRKAGALLGTPVCIAEYVRYDCGVSGSPYAITCEESKENALRATNYTFRYENGAITVSAAELDGFSVSQNKSAVYTGSAQTTEGAVAFSYGTFSGGKEDLSIAYSSEKEGDYDAALPSLTAAGVHTVYYEVTSANYRTIRGSFEFTIGKAEIGGGIAPKQESFLYSGNSFGGDGDLLDTLSLTHEGDVFSSKLYNTVGASAPYALTEAPIFTDAGSYTVYYRVTAANHEDKCGSYVIVIEPKSVTVTFTASELTKVYNKQNFDPSGVGMVSGVVQGQSLTVLFGGNRTDAGDYEAVEFTLVAGENTKRANYTLAAVGAPTEKVVDGQYSVSEEKGYVNLRIEKFVLSYDLYVGSVKTDSVEYDGKERVFRLEITNGIAGDEVTAYLSESKAGEGVASMSESAKGSYVYYVKLVGKDAGNYALEKGEDETVSFEISSKSIEITFDDSLVNAFTYGDSAAFLTIGQADFYNYLTLSDSPEKGEALSDLIVITFKKENAAASLSATSSVGKSRFFVEKKEGIDGYSFLFTINDDEEAYIEVERRALTVIAEDKVVTYGEGAIYSFTCEGFAEGEDENVLVGEVEYTCLYNLSDEKNRGVREFGYAITPYGVTSENYEITFEAGVLTVEPKEITIEYTGETKRIVYGDADAWATYLSELEENDYYFTADLAFEEDTIFDVIEIALYDGITGEKVEAADSLPVSLFGYFWAADDKGNPNYRIVGIAGEEETEEEYPEELEEETEPEYDEEPEEEYEHPEESFDYPDYLFGENSMLIVTPALLTVRYDVKGKTYDGKAFVAPTVAEGGVTAEGWRFDDADTLYTDDNLVVWYARITEEITEDMLLAEMEGEESRYWSESAPTDAGEYLVLFAFDLGDDFLNYTSDPNGVGVYGIERFTIAKKALTVTADAKQVTYGDAAPAFTLSYEGFAEGEDEKALGGNLVYACAYTVGDAAGSTFDITPSGLTAGNYQITFVKGTLTVIKRPITISYNREKPLSYVYGDASVYQLNPYAYLTIGGMGIAKVNGDAVNTVVPVTLSVGSKTGNPITEPLSGKNFGFAAKYYLFIVTPYVNANYDLTNEVLEDPRAYLEITKAPMTITAENKQVVYGDAAPAFTVTYTGWQYDDEGKAKDVVFTGELDFDCERTLTSNVGAYAITPKGLGAGNYEITYVSGLLGVNYALLTLELSVPDTVYGTAVKAPVVDDGITVTGWKNGQTAAQMVTADKIVSFVYFLKDGDKTFEEQTIEIEEEIGEDEEAFDAYMEAHSVAPTAAGTYYVYVWVDGIANYSACRDYTEFTIAKKEITVTADAKTSVYGSDLVALTATDTGIVAGDALDSVYTLTKAAGTTAGEYAITVTVAGNPNYVVTPVSGVYTIAKKAITVTAEDKESDYEDALVELTFTGAIEKDDVVCTIVTTADKTKADTYPITLTSTNNPNYVVTLVNGTYTVKAKAAKVETNAAGEKVVENTETVSKEAAKSEEGVSIKNMIQNVIDAAADAPVVKLEIAIGEDASVAFDKAALLKLAENGDVKITYTETQAADVDTSKKELKNAQLVIEISLAGATFDGGKATVTATFDNKAPGGKKAVVYFVDENGKKTDMNATFADGKVTFETTHFSTYVVEYVLTGGTIAGIAVGAAAGVAAIVVVVLFLLKKKGKKADKADDAAPEADDAEAEEAPEADTAADEAASTEEKKED